MKTAKTTGIMHSLTPEVADYELPEHGELVADSFLFRRTYVCLSLSVHGSAVDSQ